MHGEEVVFIRDGNGVCVQKRPLDLEPGDLGLCARCQALVPFPVKFRQSRSCNKVIGAYLLSFVPIE